MRMPRNDRTSYAKASDTARAQSASSPLSCPPVGCVTKARQRRHFSRFRAASPLTHLPGSTAWDHATAPTDRSSSTCRRELPAAANVPSIGPYLRSPAFGHQCAYTKKKNKESRPTCFPASAYGSVRRLDDRRGRNFVGDGRGRPQRLRRRRLEAPPWPRLVSSDCSFCRRPKPVQQFRLIDNSCHVFPRSSFGSSFAAIAADGPFEPLRSRSASSTSLWVHGNLTLRVSIRARPDPLHSGRRSRSSERPARCTQLCFVFDRPPGSPTRPRCLCDGPRASVGAGPVGDRPAKAPLGHRLQG